MYAKHLCTTVAAPGRGNRGNVPPVPRNQKNKFAKDGKESTPQPAMRIDSRKFSNFR